MIDRQSARRVAAIVTLFGAATAAVCAAEPQEARGAPPAEKQLADDYSGELPRIAPREPADALQTLRALPGFRLELVASEPLLRDPVALCFDERGRMFVVEMCDYSEQDQDFLGTIRLLEDTDGDGRFDKSSPYVEKLSWPTAVACWQGGIFVGAAPDIWYFRDSDGDGRADERRKVFTGFGRSNVQGLLNSFHWGLDHRLHGSASSSGGEIRPADKPQARAVSVSGRDFAFDPRTLEFAATSGGAQHGMCFDDWGRCFVCSNSDHIQLVMCEDRYLARNPYLAAPGARLSIAAEGPQAEVYRISPVEPWRVVRTRLRVAGLVPGPVEGGGRAAGYFTSATGVTIYRGDAWPESYRGNAVVGDVGSNIIHRKTLERNGVALLARRADPGIEFVASTDNWFRPVQFANGPDGTLYIADMYREVIEHPASLPPVIKKHLDLTSGRDRGRVYRIVPDGFQQPKPPRLDQASTVELVAQLASPNGWIRDTAARLLYERLDTQAVEPLRKLARESESPLGRMHALCALDAQQALDASLVASALKDANAGVRRQAVRLAEHLAGESAELRSELLQLVDDDDAEVRYQLAFTLGELADPARLPALAALARRDAADRWMRLAIQSSLAQGGAAVLADLVKDETFRQTAAGRDLLAELAAQTAARNQESELATVLGSMQPLTTADPGLARHLLLSIGKRASGGAAGLSALLARTDGGRWSRLLDDLVREAGVTALDSKKSPAVRCEAIESLSLAPWEVARPVLEAAADNRQPQEVQLAALATLRRFDTRDVAALVLAAWPGMSPTVRTAANELLFSRAATVEELAKAIQRGDFAAAELEPARVKRLLDDPKSPLDPQTKQKLRDAQVGKRQDVLAAYQAALSMAGDAGRGKGVFQKTCAPCHRLENVGHEIGPNLATIQNRGADAILVNVLDPNREVNPQYVNYVVATTDGRSLTGMIAAETANSVTLERAEKQSDTVLRIDIDELRSTGQSIMPEGMEKEIDVQAMADLLAYLLSVK